MKNDSNHFDVIVIGAGSGGLNIASGMNQLGFRVLLIEKSEATIGGDCLNYGCVPSKALIHIARTVQAARESGRFGLSVSGTVDMNTVADYIHEKKEHIRTRENKEYFEKKGITVVIGTASFASPSSVLVHEVEYHGTHIVLATGSRPRMPTIAGIEHTQVLTNESIFNLRTLPKNLLVLGGGPIGIELGQALAMLGARVTYIIKESRILPREDAAIAQVLQDEMVRQGVEFLFESTLEAVEEGGARIRTKEGERVVPHDALLIAVGRELQLDALGLDRAGISVEKGKIVVNEYLETTNPRVLLCGDIAGGLQFTHAAELHAGVILRNFFVPSLLSFLRKKVSTDHFAWVTYTAPEIATFGLSDAVLRERGVPFRVLENNFSDDDRAIVDEVRGRIRLLISHKGVILGGSMVAPSAGELAQELILAQTKGLTAGDLFGKIYPYPTAGRVVKSTLASYMKERLTPRAKRVLRFLYGAW